MIVKMVNYPRFPQTPEVIQKLAIELATVLKSALAQERVSIVFPTQTVMLGEK